MSIPHDVQEFLDGYPGVEDDPACIENLEFYSNTLRCQPDNCTIEVIHQDWFGDYSKLEYKHGYIQWLFPIREFGLNYASQPLQKHEIVAMKADPKIMERILRSYQLMLDFYGMFLVSPETGLVDRCRPPRNYRTRYRNLARASHNNLRISRILKCLSEFGLERFNAGFLLHVLNEQSECEELDTWGIRSSMDKWWANCIRNEEERQWIGSLIKKVRNAEEGYVFSRQDYENVISHRAQTGKLEFPPDAAVEDGEGEETQDVFPCIRIFNDDLRENVWVVRNGQSKMMSSQS